MTHPIEWCTMTSNPITGCVHGCKYCYARNFAKRLSYHHGLGALPYRLQFEHRGDPFHPAFHWAVMHGLMGKLDRARKPHRVFLGSMSDMCCKGEWDIYDDEGNRSSVRASSRAIQSTLRQHMEIQGRHTFLVLTKAPSKLLRWWPRNVHVGTSAQTWGEAELRLRWLLEVQAGLRWLSLEPFSDETFDFGKVDQKLLPEWVVIGGWSGAPLKPPMVEAAWRVNRALHVRGVPVFVKRNVRDCGPLLPWSMQLPTRFFDTPNTVF